MTTPEPRLPDDYSDVEELPRSSGRLRVAIEIGMAVLVLAGIYYLFAPEQEIALPPLKQQEIDPIIREQIDTAHQQATAPAPAAQGEQPADEAQLQVATRETTPEAAQGTTQSTPLAQPEGTAARKLIGDLRSGAIKLDSAELLQRAQDYRESGNLTDSYLLLFYAARKGDGQAAFDLASMQDPNHFRAGGSLLASPDAYQAQKWYREAAAHDVPQAKARLQALRDTIKKQADAGDMAARRLLLNWQ
jgi:TPR repeat protein